MTLEEIGGLAIRVYFVLEVAAAVLVITWWRQLGRTGRLAGMWIVAAAGVGLAGLVAAKWVHNSQYITFFWYPISGWFAFRALASVHGEGRVKRAIEGYAVVFALLWLVFALTIETFGQYSLVNSPLHALSLAVLAAFTLVTRVGSAETELMLDTGFVLSAAWLIYAVPTVFLTLPTRTWLAQEKYEQIMLYFTFRNIVAIGAYILLLRGIGLARSGQPTAAMREFTP
ncbi:MAG TPA: hypothetical protein VFN22_03735 [Gemmatimonadales bacterium]|nr:hypothetical protein [Gemmatimonadales bacterium]